MDSLTLTLGIDGDDSLPDVVLPPEPDPWTPAELPGLRAWWNAATITGKAPGDPIASLPSSGGVTNTLSQVTTGVQPTYHEDFNGTGKPALSFDGNDYMAMSDLSMASEAPALVMGALYKYSAIDAVAQLKFMMTVRASGSASPQMAMHLSNSATVNKLIGLSYVPPAGGGAVSRYSGVTADTGAHVMISRMVFHGEGSPLLEIRRDGTVILSETPGFTPAPLPAGNSTGAYLGASGSVANTGIQGLIAQAAIIRGDLSLEDIQKMEGHWAWAGGIQGNLPNGHPWKNRAPTVDD